MNHIRSQRERKKMIDPRGEKLNETGMIKGNETEIGERSPILRLTGWMANEGKGGIIPTFKTRPFKMTRSSRGRVMKRIRRKIANILDLVQ